MNTYTPLHWLALTVSAALMGLTLYLLACVIRWAWRNRDARRHALKQTNRERR